MAARLLVLALAVLLAACTVDAHVVVTQPTPTSTRPIMMPASPLATPRTPKGYLPNGLPIPGMLSGTVTP